ncbi:MAG: twin-arginine translocase TatA/TatE family subunit [Deltaproteobacteria bacterium]|jgi:Tat protein translocase TatB subunit|nr:twin-arginine translocase TatA/TatE family subunit [Deltaproteobacteria bacterium]
MGFGVGWSEILIVVLVACLVIKPERLPETARFLGQAYRRFRLWYLGVSHTLQREAQAIAKLDEPLRTLSKEVKDLGETARLGLPALENPLKDSLADPLADPWPNSQENFLESEPPSSNSPASDPSPGRELAAPAPAQPSPPSPEPGPTVAKSAAAMGYTPEYPDSPDYQPEPVATEGPDSDPLGRST